MSKNQLTFSSLGVVFALYLFYGWVVVPLVVPQRTFSQTRSGTLLASPGDSVARDEYADLFPEGAWERTSPKRMQFGNTIVLFRERDDSVKGVIKISPCTIIQLAADETASTQDADETAAKERHQKRLRQAVVMQTREYALLEFSGAIDLAQPTAIQLKQGQLFGDIVVTSDGSSPEIDDDLRITCRDITFTESPLVTSITTLSSVDFKFGKSVGRGTILTIEFSRNSLDASVVKTLSKVEFERLDFLNLVFAGLPVGPQTTPQTTVNAAPNESSLAIQCRGIFRFIPDLLNAGNWIAEFNDNVRVKRTNATGPPDTLEGQSLWVYFTPSPSSEASPRDDIVAGFQSLTMSKLLALGQPAILRAPTYDNLVVQGERLCYSLNDRQIAVEKRDDTSVAISTIDIRSGTHHLEGGRIHAAADENGEFSSLEISGAGQLRSTLIRDNRPSPISLSWNKKLTGKTDSDDPTRIVFNVDDNVELGLDPLGKMRADGVQLVCRRSGVNAVHGADKSLGGIETLQPESARAWGEIILASTFGTCLVKRLEVYFSDVSTPLRAATTRPLKQTVIPPELLLSRPVNPYQTSVVTSVASSQTLSPIRQVQYVEPSSPPLAPIGGSTGGLTPISQLSGANAPFDVSGEQMKILVLTPSGRTEISQVWLSGNVHVVQRLQATTVGVPSSPPLEIRGREVHIWNPETLATEIRISGDAEQMATFQGRGIILTTTNLVVSRQQNTLWSEGIGRLTARGSALSLNSLANTTSPLGAVQTSSDAPLVIDWNRGMSFNGRELLFEGVSDSTAETGVRILYEHRQIQARRVVVRLASLLSFFERAAEPIDVQTLEAHGSIFIQNTQYAGSVMTSRDRAQFGRDVTLTFHLPSGSLMANGYGRFQSTFLGQQISIPSISSMRDNAAAPSEPDTGLGYIDVTFHDGLDGNVNSRSVTLAGQVDCKYTPVNRWDELIDTADPAAFVKRGLLLTCGRLVIAANPNGTANEIEFRAEDKATIEGRGGQYTGTAESIQYSQSKDLLVMSGNGMANAILWQRDRPGDLPQKIELKRIEYQPRANILRASGLQQGIITQGGM
ncbi:MAG: hypothetical protein ACRC46_06570 [Thermoguttaceae bacterium]